MSDAEKRGLNTLPGNPMAPPVYRPPASPKPVQAKPANGVMIQKPGAPPVYRPQPSAISLPAKIAPVPQLSAPGQGLRQSAAPPVYRPAAAKHAQPKTFAPHSLLTAPPAFRPQQQRITQPKMARAGSATIQAMPVFDSRLNRVWQPDRQNCSVCMAATSWLHRHHCRVCGRFVCDACGGQTFQVRNRYTQAGRSATAGPTTERVCVDCVLEQKIALAAAVPAFQQLAAAAQAGAGRAIAVQWMRTAARAYYSSGTGVITLDPTQPDPFSLYLFELTNAAQTRVHGQVGDFRPGGRQKETGRKRRGSFGDDPEGIERFAFHREFVEYSGTARHDRVAQAINAAGLGFAVARNFQGAGGGYDHFAQHMGRQAQAGNGQPSHTDRYRQQHREHWEPQRQRRLSASGAHDPTTRSILERDLEDADWLPR